MSFSGFKIPNIFEFELFRFKKICSKLIDFMGLRENFDQNLAKTHLFLAKFAAVENWICIFVLVWVLAIFRDQVFFRSGFGKIAKTG